MTRPDIFAWDDRHAWLWAGAMYACNYDPALAALAFRGWITTIRRGYVTAGLAP